MNMSNNALLTNPFTLPETLIKLRSYLKATLNADSQALLEKAEAKSAESAQFAEEFEHAFLFGSTVQLRELFSHFGDYGEKSRGTFPFYPHVDAVNSIDTAVHHIKLGVDTEESANEYNWLHNHNSARA